MHNRPPPQHRQKRISKALHTNLLVNVQTRISHKPVQGQQLSRGPLIHINLNSQSLCLNSQLDVLILFFLKLRRSTYDPLPLHPLCTAFLLTPQSSSLDDGIYCFLHGYRLFSLLIFNNSHEALREK